MRFESKTLDILKSFSSLNPGMIFRPGNTLTVLSEAKAVVAKAELAETFENDFAIGDVPQFLNSLSLVDEPTVEFRDTCLIINGKDKRKTKINYTSPDVLHKPPKKDLVLPSVDVEFNLTQDNLNKALKAMGVLGLPEIHVVGDGENLILRAADHKVKEGGNYHDIVVGTTDKKFTAIFDAANLKLLPGDYVVSISKQNITMFVGKDVKYWIAVLDKSTFE